MSEIVTGGALKMSELDTPTRVGEVIGSISEMANIPNPYMGMRVYVKDEEKSYIIRSLKSKEIGGVLVPNAQVDEYSLMDDGKPVGWSDEFNMNNYWEAGIYNITGIRRGNNDNMPITNVGENASISARLIVTVTPEGDTTYRHIIGQTLILSNAQGFETKVYTRSAFRSSYDGETYQIEEWTAWKELQSNQNVGELTSLDDLNNFTDNGIYSGVVNLGPLTETFVMIVINDYALGVSPRRVSQFKYSLTKLSGFVYYLSRSGYGDDAITWGDWEITNKDAIDKMITDAVDTAISNILDEAPEKFDTLREIAAWIETHGAQASEMLAQIQANTSSIDNINNSIDAISEAFSNETTARQNADTELTDNQVRTWGVSASADGVNLLGKNNNGANVHSIDIPSATTEKAGVMSAADKVALEDTSKKTNNIRVVEASSETEEIVICNNDETEEIVKINNEGLAAKKIFNLDGEELKPSGLHSITDNPATLEICDDNQTPILVVDEDGNLNTSSFSSFGTITNLFKGKTMLYIGDSISTENVWHWKGYIQEKIGLKHVKYASEDTTNVTPAVGGITIRPHNDDDTRPMNAGAAEVGSSAKSIWWRCCNKRLNIYDFDYINLFGGTNDIYDENLYVGTIDDTPLLDTDVDDLTTLDLSQVSFASAFMGCIEMLRRDFPNKPLFICTLLVNGYSKTPDVVKIQMLAAQKYGLKVVPFYYSELNSQNYQYLCNGFHPNQIAARIMEKIFIEYTNL